jgi:hypothetical protein
MGIDTVFWRKNRPDSWHRDALRTYQRPAVAPDPGAISRLMTIWRLMTGWVAWP